MKIHQLKIVFGIWSQQKLLSGWVSSLHSLQFVFSSFKGLILYSNLLIILPLSLLINFPELQRKFIIGLFTIGFFSARQIYHTIGHLDLFQLSRVWRMVDSCPLPAFLYLSAFLDFGHFSAYFPKNIENFQ